jgi:zeta-carotene desaturase
LRGEGFLEDILSLRPAPIISINLWFERAITELEFAGLRGATIQWLFNRGRILGTNENYVSLVLSGAHEFINRSKEELVAAARYDLGELLPGVRQCKVARSLVIKERFATFSPAVGVDALRPGPTTPIRGLYLAGDWTATGLPATIEGAVQSGYSAAAAILQDA